MSNSVVPAAAVAHAKQLVHNKKLTKRTEDQKPAQNEQQAADKDHDAANAIQTEQADHSHSSMSSTTLSGDFSFIGALSAAAESSASFTVASSADDSGGSMSDDHDRSGGLIIGAAAVGAVGLGVAVLAGGGGHSNTAPTFTAGDTKAATTNEDTAVTIAVPATDADNDPLAYSVTTNPTKGTLSGGTSDGNFKYTPNANVNGTDSFVVKVDDGHGGTDSITVNVTITAVNDAPVPDTGNQAAVTTNEDTPTPIVIAFKDPEGDAVSFTVKTGPSHGTFALVDGKNVYTPTANFNGSDSIVITVADNKGATVDETIAITVTAVNDAPTVAATQTVSTEAGKAATGTVVGSDVDIATNADVLTYSIKTDGGHGTATIGGADGKFTYTPAAGFSGDDTFVVNVADKGGLSATETVTVHVGPTIVTKSIDIGTASTVETIDAAGSKFSFTDDTKVVSNVIINHFTSDDVIVTNAKADPDGAGPLLGDYSFGTGDDPNDLSITFSTGGVANIILLNDVLADNAPFISDYASAVTAVGFNFMTFA